MSVFYWGGVSKDRMKGVNELLIDCATSSLFRSPVDMKIPWMGGFRTASEQQSIYKEGNSKCDGYNIISDHQLGNAIDIIPVYKGYKNTKAMNYFAKIMLWEWQKLIAAGKAEGYIMEWGGTYGSQSWDRPHFGIKKV